MGVSITLPIDYTRPAFVLGTVICLILINDRDVVRKLRGKPYLLIFPLFALFVGLLTAASFQDKDIVPVYNPVTFTLMFEGYIFQLLCLVMYALAKGRVMDLLNFTFRVMAGLAVVTDMLMFAGIHFTDGAFETYLIGTKFDIVYMHMNLMTLFFVKMKLGRRQKKEVKLPLRLLLTFLILNVIISLRVDCNTGMLGSVLIVLITYWCDRSDWARQKLFGSVKFFMIIAAVSALFAYYIFLILNMPLVQHIIVDQLGRSLTLTGRTDIYELFPVVMEEHWLWGYGLGNSYPVCVSLFGYTDVQNAILQWVIQTGVPASACMLLLFAYMISYYRKKARKMCAAPILALLYVYLLLGTVEITVNNNFWLFIILLFMLCCDDLMPPAPKKKNLIVVTDVARRSARRMERKQ